MIRLNRNWNWVDFLSQCCASLFPRSKVGRSDGESKRPTIVPASFHLGSLGDDFSSLFGAKWSSNFGLFCCFSSTLVFSSAICILLLKEINVTNKYWMSNVEANELYKFLQVGQIRKMTGNGHEPAGVYGLICRPCIKVGLCFLMGF